MTPLNGRGFQSDNFEIDGLGEWTETTSRLSQNGHFQRFWAFDEMRIDLLFAQIKHAIETVSEC